MEENIMYFSLLMRPLRSRWYIVKIRSNKKFFFFFSPSKKNYYGWSVTISIMHRERNGHIDTVLVMRNTFRSQHYCSSSYYSINFHEPISPLNPEPSYTYTAAVMASQKDAYCWVGVPVLPTHSFFGGFWDRNERAGGSLLIATRFEQRLSRPTPGIREHLYSQVRSNDVRLSATAWLMPTTWFVEQKKTGKDDDYHLGDVSAVLLYDLVVVSIHHDDPIIIRNYHLFAPNDHHYWAILTTRRISYRSRLSNYPGDSIPSDIYSVRQVRIVRWEGVLQIVRISTGDYV